MTANIVSEEKDIPVQNELALAKLLEAAYVLQEHNRKMQKPAPPHEPAVELPATNHPVQTATSAPEAAKTDRSPNGDYTFILAQIVETQRQIQVRQLDLQEAISLLVGRLIEMTHAGGAAIGMVEGQMLRYRAVAGTMTVPAGTEISVEKALSAASLRRGQIMRCGDVGSERSLDAAECRRRGIHALIAVPIYHDAGIAGSVELYFSGSQTFAEQDVHTCQLMTGLVTEALARANELTLKKSLATERAAMIETLERLKPNLAALVDTQAARQSPPQPATLATPSSEPAVLCRKCSNELEEDEQFCGRCGSPRSGSYEPPTMQSKVASLMNLQPPPKKSAASALAQDTAHEEEVALAEDIALPDGDDGLAETVEPADKLELTILPTDQAGDTEDEEIAAEPGSVMAAASSSPVTAANWSSAAAARDFLEHLGPPKRDDALARFWKSRRGDVYLALAVLLVAVAIRFGLWSDRPVGASGNPTAATARHKPADADLSFFDRILVNLGLAEAPAPVEDKGNPETQVWVDLHTALYYCPGTDLYGKTPTGKYTTQRDAQLDQFEPAYRKVCN
jgi:putative methionine-R-sulfoxide reductase with GAF domain